MQASPATGPLAAAALSLLPTPVFARLVRALMQGVRRRHAKLFEEFGRLDPALVHIRPTDLRHAFAISYGDGRMEVQVLRGPPGRKPDAVIRASLANLVDMLEGRIDGDAMFFTRGIEITGSTAVIVGLRNTLDREEIVLRDDLASLFGRLERPARRMGRALEAGIDIAEGGLATLHRALHGRDAPARDLGAECDALGGEVKTLRAELAKLKAAQHDHKHRRPEPAAAGAP